MNYTERPVTFECDGDTLIGILSAPGELAVTTGLIVIVGGPQYRAGSHRQFVLLCRHLAERGIVCLRFDYRGMGDSDGGARTFEGIEDDIRSAIDAIQKEVPSIRKVVLWGLCDGASAACFHAPKDRRVAGLVLLNPWVRTEVGKAKTYLKHYYAGRLFDPRFWRKLRSGKVSFRGSILSLARMVRSAALTGKHPDANYMPALELPARMAAALTQADVPLLVILSGRDYVANEFEGAIKGRKEWELIDSATVMHLENANHTFATKLWRDEVAAETATWLAQLERRVGRKV